MDGPESPASPYRLIESNRALTNACARWAREPYIALDTEFERSRTFYARAGLIQVLAGHEVDLVDPTMVTDFSPLGEVLAASQPIKILHAGGEDIGLLRQLCAREPRAIFDTQVVAAFVGYGFSTGYRALVNVLCGVELPKDETRSDWLKRPLSESQLHYATSDVVHLDALYRVLRDALVKQGREDWAREECERAAAATKEIAAAEAYRLVPNAWQLDAPALGILRALATWRENEARRSDVPRAQLLPDPTLFELAKQAPSRVEQLAPLAQTRAIALRRHPETLIRIIEKAAALRADQLPPALSPPVDMRTHGAMLKAMKASVKAAAEKWHMPATLLAPNRMLNDLVKRIHIDKGDGLTSDLSGWRGPLIGERLLAIVTAQNDGAA